MEITDVRVRKTYPEGKMRAIVSVTFDDQFVVHDIKVIEGQSGFFIAMPSRKTPDGEFKDIAHPINMGTRRQMQESVLKAYDLAIEQEESNSIEEADVELEVDYEEE
ncbi:septation regulator SpoVG [Eubacteriaceae bacterium ES2]|nr:septation regulator SpoVG [Eubacteriaceae bacterium ES2]